MIKVGYKYYTARMNTWVSIFHKMPGPYDKPYIGITDKGYVFNFDKFGKDEHLECGGYWYALDLSTEQPSSVKFERPQPKKVEITEEQLAKAWEQASVEPLCPYITSASSTFIKFKSTLGFKE